MRKFIVVALAFTVAAGCAGGKTIESGGSKTVVNSGSKRPDWVSGDSVQYPRESYMTGVGLGDDAAAASDRARAQIAQVFSSLVSVTSEISASEKTTGLDKDAVTESSQDVAESVRTSSQKILEGVEIVQTWQDPQTRQYFALAVLDRAKAASSFRQKLAELDMELTSWESSFNSAADKFGKAKAAANALALLAKRSGLSNDLRTISGSAGAGADSANELVPAFKKAMADLNITVTVKGDSAQAVETGIIKALNSLGFTARSGEKDERTDISVTAEAASQQIRKDDSGPWKWAQHTVTVSAAETATGKVFMQFDITDRQAATDIDTAFSRSREAVGAKTAQRIQSGIQDYFGGK